MKKKLVVFYLLSVMVRAHGQSPGSLTLESCYTRAEQNYPLIKQRELIAMSKEYSISNAAKGILPVLSINGQETYQSDVTQIPIRDTNITPLSKNQYKIYGELAVNLYDGGTIRNQKQSYTAVAQVEQQKLEVELYKLKERINQLFFGVLLLDAQLDQNELLSVDIERGIKKTEAAIISGAALKSSADALHAELLKAIQHAIEIKATRSAYLEMLGFFMGQSLSEVTEFKRPQSLGAVQEISRPELMFYDYQRQAIDVQNKMLTTRNLPKLSAFFQGGYGRPALNMLNNQPDSYYIGGIRLNWNISGWYTYKKEKALLDINRRNVDLQKEVFIFNTQLTLRNQQGEVNKLQKVLSSDGDIIALREKIKNTASAQLENGVINANDYLREVTQENQARQNKILHEIQLLMAQYTLQTTAGI